MKALGLSAVVVLFAGMSAVSYAEVKKAPEAKPEAKKAPDAKAPVADKAVEEAPKAPTGPPTPSPELEKLKLFGANWNCAGAGMDPTTGTATAYKSTLKAKWDLKKFWLTFTYDAKKSKTNPMAFQGKGFMGYDTASKKFVFIGADDMGGWINLTSAGWDAAGTAMVFNGNASNMGQTMPMRFTFTKGATEKEMTFMIEVSMGGKWATGQTDVCKK